MRAHSPGFAAAYLTGSLWSGLLAAIVVGLAAGAVMGLLTVTLGANQHVSGLGLTICLIGLSETSANRLLVQRVGGAAHHSVRAVESAGFPGRRRHRSPSSTASPTSRS